jgi:hypothetical protein
MKFLHIAFRFEYAEKIEEVLDRHELQDYVRYSMAEGRDRDGKHFGTKAFPGNTSVVQAQVPDESLEELLTDLKRFKEEKSARGHIRVLVLPVERCL